MLTGRMGDRPIAGEGTELLRLQHNLVPVAQDNGFTQRRRWYVFPEQYLPEQIIDFIEAGVCTERGCSRESRVDLEDLWLTVSNAELEIQGTVPAQETGNIGQEAVMNAFRLHVRAIGIPVTQIPPHGNDSLRRPVDDEESACIFIPRRGDTFLDYRVLRNHECQSEVVNRVHDLNTD